MRKTLLKGSLILSLPCLLFFSCKKSSTEVSTHNEVSQTALDKIFALGFSNKNVTKEDGDYIVEGDIRISESDLSNVPESQFLRVGSEEQYRTYNLVKKLPREITVQVSTSLPFAYIAAADEAISRYNAEGLQLQFKRVTSGGEITITAAPITAGYLASAGFPSKNGSPYRSIKVNSAYLGNDPGTNFLAFIFTHEMGHCIGFRHTDYATRQSCGGSPANEGASNVGAVHIPGTPTGYDATSWMLACGSMGDDRPFNSNDKTALNYLY